MKCIITTIVIALVCIYTTKAQGFTDTIYSQDKNHYLIRTMTKDSVTANVTTNETISDTSSFLNGKYYLKNITIREKIVKSHIIGTVPEELWKVSDYAMNELVKKGKIQYGAVTKLKNHFWFLAEYNKEFSYGINGFPVGEESFSLGPSLLINLLFFMVGFTILFIFYSVCFRKRMAHFLLILLLVACLSMFLGMIQIVIKANVNYLLNLSTYLGGISGFYIGKILEKETEKKA